MERVGRDPVYWVRREASFAVGALAKVVPQEVVQMSLVCLFFEFIQLLDVSVPELKELAPYEEMRELTSFFRLFDCLIDCSLAYAQ